MGSSFIKKVTQLTILLALGLTFITALLSGLSQKAAFTPSRISVSRERSDVAFYNEGTALAIAEEKNVADDLLAGDRKLIEEVNTASQCRGILIGAGWGILNLWMIQLFLKEYLLMTPRNPLKYYPYLLVKFPLLYLIGYLLLVFNLASPLTFVIGFSLLMVAIFLSGCMNCFTEKSETNRGTNL